MSVVYVRPASPEDVELFEARACDREELWAGFRHTPKDAMLLGMQTSDTYAVFLHGKCAGVFGVVPSPEKCGIGAPWAVFSDVITEHPLPFLRASRRTVNYWRERFYGLRNFVDARNTVVISWLAWRGFRIYPAKPFVPDGQDFHLFAWGQYV